MAIKRSSTAVWNGTGKEGNGSITSQSGVLNNTQYGFKSRFDDGIGTNPEELIAAAHAGCFTMKLAFNLNASGYTADELKTKCEVILEDGAVTASNLTLEAKVEGIEFQQFEELVKNAEANCPISKLLNCTISVVFTLNG